MEPVLKTNDTWYGMTYNEDIAAVKDSVKKMLENGVYKADLFREKSARPLALNLSL